MPYPSLPQPGSRNNIIPMLDIAVAYNRYKFIGNEFLTWLWFTIDTNQPLFKTVDKTITSLYLGNRIVLENSVNDASELITIKGDDAGLEEGRLSLRKGAVVIEMNLSYKTENQEWRFTIKGESLAFSGLKVPETGPVETKDDIEGMVLEKAYLYEKAIDLVNRLFNMFLKLRSTVEWNQKTVPLTNRLFYRVLPKDSLPMLLYQQPRMLYAIQTHLRQS